jgi:hypothetical protein
MRAAGSRQVQNRGIYEVNSDIFRAGFRATARFFVRKQSRANRGGRSGDVHSRTRIPEKMSCADFLRGNGC